NVVPIGHLLMQPFVHQIAGPLDRHPEQYRLSLRTTRSCAHPVRFAYGADSGDPAGGGAMMRILATLQPIWACLLIICLAMIPMMIIGVVPVDWAPPIALVIIASSVLLNAAPRSRPHAPFEMMAAVRGDWVALNSPVRTLPSHGTRGLGQYAAVDIIRPRPPDTPPMVQNALRSCPAAEFPTFGA